MKTYNTQIKFISFLFRGKSTSNFSLFTFHSIANIKYFNKK
jgi:hypothetical protein